jgi:hypothetical protein
VVWASWPAPGATGIERSVVADGEAAGDRAGADDAAVVLDRAAGAAPDDVAQPASASKTRPSAVVVSAR